MTTSASALAHQPVRVTARMLVVLVTIGGVLANSLDKARGSPLDSVIWTYVLVSALYLCVLAGTAMAGRPLSSRTATRLEAQAILVFLAATAWGAVTATLARQWVDAVACALIAAANGGLLWLVARQLRELRQP